MNQVRNLVRRGLVPSRRSAANSYLLEFKSLVILCNIKSLMNEGITMRTMLRLLTELQAALPKDTSFAGVRLSSIGGRLLVEDEYGLWDARTRQSEIMFEPNFPRKPIPMRVASFRGAVMEKAFADYSSDDWYNHGIELEEKGDTDSNAAYERAIKLDPDNVDAHINLGRLHQLDGDLGEANSCYMKALALDPGNQIANFNVGTLLDEVGNFDDAVRHYKLAPSIADSHYCLWIIYDSMGEARLARKHKSIYSQMTQDLD